MDNTFGFGFEPCVGKIDFNIFEQFSQEITGFIENIHMIAAN